MSESFRPCSKNYDVGINESFKHDCKGSGFIDRRRIILDLPKLVS
jgi:hypothetical protein